MRPTKAVILAHPQDALRLPGPGPRFVRDSLPPAPLLSVANRPLLAHALDWLEEAGVREAAVIVPCELAEPAREAAACVPGDLDISWCEQVPHETLSWSLAQLGSFLDGEPFVLHMADSVAKQSLSSLIADSEHDGALLVEDDSCSGGLGQVVELHANGGGPRRVLSGTAAGVAVLSADAIEAARSLDVSSEFAAETLAEAIGDRGGAVGEADGGVVGDPVPAGDDHLAAGDLPGLHVTGAEVLVDAGETGGVEAGPGGVGREVQRCVHGGTLAVT